MTTFQIVSDLHIEFSSKLAKFNFVKPSAPVLCLLGDICCLGSNSDFDLFKRFINEILPHYELILMISGNHEYYYNKTRSTGEITYENTMQGIDEKLKAYFKATSNKLHYLNNSSVKLKINNTTYTIIGSTLWSWIPEAQRKLAMASMNDYSYVYVATDKKPRLITADDVASIHVKNVKYIKSQITKAKKLGNKVIIFTHHKPYLSADYNVNSLDVAYQSDLSPLFGDPVVLWGYGHTHIVDDSMKNKTRLYSNPKGYPGQRTKYNKKATIMIK